jgi:hypothetical protein
MPSVKQLEMKKIASRYKRIYNKPKTPIKRLIEIQPNNIEIKKNA